MRSRVLLVVPILMVLPARPAAGQGAPALGVGLGFGDVPGTFHPGCNDAVSRYPALEVRASVPVGGFALEGWAAGEGFEPQNDCLPLGPRHAGGVHTDRLDAAEPRTGRYAAGLRLRREVNAGLPLGIAAGGGWMEGGVPYAAAGASVRTRGRLRLRADAGRRWLRVPYDRAVREWEDYQVVRELSRERTHGWWGGWEARVGLEAALR